MAIDDLLADIDSMVREFGEKLGLVDANLARGPQLPGQNVAEWISAMTSSPGIIVHGGLARSTPCTRVHLPDGDLVYSQGIIGPLDREQEALYCALGCEEVTPTPDQVAYYKAMVESSRTAAAQTQHIGDPKERVEAFFASFGRELEGRGTEADLP